MDTKTRLLPLFLLPWAVAISGCSGAIARPANRTAADVAAMTTDSERLAAFFEEAFQLRLRRSPWFQTELGIKIDYGAWDDISEEHQHEDYQLAQTYLSRLRSEFDFAKLSRRDKISYRVFEHRAEQRIAAFEWRHHQYAATQVFGLHEAAPTLLITFHRIDSVADAEAYLSRLRNMRWLFAQLEDGLRLRESRQCLPPKFVFAKLLEVSRNVISGRPFDKAEKDAPLFADFKGKVGALDIPTEDKERLVAAAREALVESVKPAYESLMALFARQEAIATTEDGVWKLPGGDAYYDFALAMATTTDKSAEEIHQIGLTEMVRIHGEIREVMAKTGFRGTMKEFFAFTRSDPQFYFANDDAGRAAYLDKVQQTLAAVRARLDELFITKPKADLVVKRVEAYRERAAPSAFYEAPAADGSRPGVYYENLFDMKAKPIYEIPALVFHEGIPGHHMQIAITQELVELPKFRRFGNVYNAYTEGWGLYSELVPKEIGLYPDAYSAFGRLSMELWRAARLVVDTGIHRKRWTRQQAIDYLRANTPTPTHEVISEVERYIVWPGQATGYKIGMLKIVELRDRAKAELGDGFDIREFHDAVLRSGPVPLGLLEELVDDWIAAQRPRPPAARAAGPGSLIHPRRHAL